MRTVFVMAILCLVVAMSAWTVEAASGQDGTVDGQCRQQTRLYKECHENATPHKKLVDTMEKQYLTWLVSIHKPRFSQVPVA